VNGNSESLLQTSKMERQRAFGNLNTHCKVNRNALNQTKFSAHKIKCLLEAGDKQLAEPG